MNNRLNNVMHLQNIDNTVFFLLIFVSYFQVPFSELSVFIAPLMALYMLLKVNDIIAFFSKYNNLLCLWYLLIYLLINIFFVCIYGYDIWRAFRFFFILFFIVLAFGIKDNNLNIKYKIFMCLSICKVAFLLFFAISMYLDGDYTLYRLWAQTNNYGDMYFVYDFIPRIQIHGNALLILAFLFSVYYKNKITMMSTIILVGILVAGNLSFIIAISTFFLYWYIKKNFKKITLFSILSMLLVIPICYLVFGYAVLENEKKSDVSNYVRAVQIELLTDHDSIILGNGLGSKVFGMNKIGYPEDGMYYEVQFFYILYQIGVLGMMYFILLNLYFLKQIKNIDACIFYLVYLMSACSNPYFFDSTHVLAIYFLSNIPKKQR